jgi:hypothetical protein
MLARFHEAIFIRVDLNLSQMLESILHMMLSPTRSIFFLFVKKKVKLDHPHYLPDWFFANFGYTEYHIEGPQIIRCC